MVDADEGKNQEEEAGEDVKPPEGDADGGDDEEDDEGEDGEDEDEFDSSDEEILTKSGESSRGFYLDL